MLYSPLSLQTQRVCVPSFPHKSFVPRTGLHSSSFSTFTFHDNQGNFFAVLQVNFEEVASSNLQSAISLATQSPFLQVPSSGSQFSLIGNARFVTVRLLLAQAISKSITRLLTAMMFEGNLEVQFLVL